jgi:hypothetical protein
MSERQIQGNSIKTFTGLVPPALVLIIAAVFSPVQVLGGEMGTADANGTAREEPGPDRKDKVFGTTDEGIRIGRDSGGNKIIRVRPPEKPQDPEYPLPPVLVEPKVEWPRQKGGGGN